MKNNAIFEKYNIIFVVLLFLLPILAFDLSYIFISIINHEWDKKEQERKAVYEAETLSAEADFNVEFSRLFKDFFDVLNSDIEKIETNNSVFLSNHLNQIANRVFARPFPDYKLYVFKIDSKSNRSDLIFYKDENIKAKRVLSMAFEHLYRLNTSDKKDSKTQSTKSGAKSLLGEFTNLEAIATAMRATPAFTNGIHKNSWFIWDYTVNKNQDVYGAILISNDIKNCNENSLLLALNNLRLRGLAVGAFIPLYKDYGEPVYQNPLDKSDTFKNCANT